MDTRIHLLGSRNSCINQIMYELRDEQVQTDRLRFRNNMEKLGQLMAYEISRFFTYEKRLVTTPLGELEMDLPADEPVLVSILRAGIPFHNGFLSMLDRADNGFISAYRHHTKGNEFVIKIEYLASPDLTNRDLILIDPMIATGKSMALAYREIVEAAGLPRQVFLAGIIASEEGADYALRTIPASQLWVAAIDKELTARSYIVPGLGDAGDLAFGPKA